MPARGHPACVAGWHSCQHRQPGIMCGSDQTPADAATWAGLTNSACLTNSTSRASQHWCHLRSKTPHHAAPKGPLTLLRQHCATLYASTRIHNSTAATCWGGTHGAPSLSCCHSAARLGGASCRHSQTLYRGTWQLPPVTCHQPGGLAGWASSREAQMPAGPSCQTTTRVTTVAQTAPGYRYTAVIGQR